jgi:hypothetical protein
MQELMNGPQGSAPRTIKASEVMDRTRREQPRARRVEKSQQDYGGNKAEERARSDKLFLS